MRRILLLVAAPLALAATACAGLQPPDDGGVTPAERAVSNAINAEGLATVRCLIGRPKAVELRIAAAARAAFNLRWLPLLSEDQRARLKGARDGFDLACGVPAPPTP